MSWWLKNTQNNFSPGMYSVYKVRVKSWSGKFTKNICIILLFALFFFIMQEEKFHNWNIGGFKKQWKWKKSLGRAQYQIVNNFQVLSCILIFRYTHLKNNNYYFSTTNISSCVSFGKFLSNHFSLMAGAHAEFLVRTSKFKRKERRK